MKSALTLAALLVCTTPARAEWQPLNADDIAAACWVTVQLDLDSASPRG